MQGYKKKYNYFLWLLIVTQSTLFLMFGLWRHWGYLTSINDLGCFDQAVWRAANGLSLVNTSNFSKPIQWLGFHFQPVLYFFVPFYKVLPSVNWFILAQSIALPFAAWPIFRIVEQLTKSEVVAFLWAVAFMCNPFLLNASIWDFHPVSIAVPFLALALLAVEQKRPLLLLGSCIVVIGCKEHFGLAVAGLGLLYWVRHRNFLIGVSFCMVGVIALLFIVGSIMPSLSPTGKQIMLSEGLGQLSRYGWLGGSIQEILKKVIYNPIYILKTLFLDMGGYNYLIFLLLPFLFFPLFAISFLLPAAGDILANLLSANPMPRGIFSYHSVTIIPVLAVAGIHGCCQLKWLRKKFSLIELSSCVLMVNLGLAYWLGPFLFPGSADIWQTAYPMAFYDKKETLVKEIVGDGSLSVQANIGAHFSQTTNVYRYPEKVGDVDFIVLRLESPTMRLQPHDKGVIGTLAHHLQMPPEQYLDSVEELLYDEHYTIFLWDSPWLVMGRNQQTQVDTKSANEKIDQLRNEWLGKGSKNQVITFYSLMHNDSL